MISYLKNHKELLKYILQPQELAIYCCGPTIYQNLHKGNYRSLMLLDYIFKTRQILDLKTRVIVNITDIDDKIFNWFPEKPIRDILQDPIYKDKTQKVLSDFYKSLSLLRTSYKKWTFIRVSEELEDLRKTVLLIKEVQPMPEGLKVKTLPFCLWKGGHLVFSNTEDSFPCQGHPSWHLECSHIIKKYLGNFKKILHLGGIDLKVLHHPNEIALLKLIPDHCISEVTFAYSGLYSIEGNKMSKSLKNERYFEKDSIEEIVNYYLSDFNRPLVETKKRIDQISLFTSKLPLELTILKKPLKEEFLELIKDSPSSLYRTDRSKFIKLIRIFYFSSFS